MEFINHFPRIIVQVYIKMSVKFYEFFNLFDDELKKKLEEDYTHLEFHSMDQLKEKIQELCDKILFLKQKDKEREKEHDDLIAIARGVGYFWCSCCNK